MIKIGSTKPVLSLVEGSEFRNSKQIQIDERQTHQMFQTGGDQIRGLENSNSSGFTFVSDFELRISDLRFSK